MNATTTTESFAEPASRVSSVLTWLLRILLVVDAGAFIAAQIRRRVVA